MFTGKQIAVGTLIISIFLLVGTMKFNWELFEVAGCKNVYCNDFNFICCSEDTGNPEFKSASLDAPCLGCLPCSGSAKYAMQCPTYASRCVIDTSVDVYSSCSKVSNWLGCPKWECTGKIKSGFTGEFEAGTWAVRIIDDGSFNVKIYQLKLFDCGRSACAYQASGIPLTSSGCTWVTDKRVYDSNGNLVANPQSGQSMEYTVPPGKCYLYTTGNLRRVCGDTCEICERDDDCLAGHTYQYNGKGAECQSGQLIIYGCRQYEQTCLDKDILPDGTEKCVGGYATNSRCEVVETKAIGCCPQSDYCGVNAFCDPATFTCKSSGQVECTQDWECGVATSCDYASRTLKKPTCESNKCIAKEIQSVECCYDENCATGYYCGSDYKCYEQVQQKTQCPLECCEREDLYFDKPCPSDKQCVNNQCVGQGGDGLPQGMWAMFFGLIAGALSFLMYSANALREKDWVGIAIGLIIGLVVGIVVWYILDNILIILAGSIVLAILGGAVLYFFGGVILFIIMILMWIIRTIRGD